MICVFLFVMELLPKHIRVNKIRYPESTSNMLIYLSYDAYSSRTGRSDHATLARSSSSTEPQAPKPTTQWASRERQTRFCTSLLPINRCGNAGDAWPAAKKQGEHTTESLNSHSIDASRAV